MTRFQHLGFAIKVRAYMCIGEIIIWGAADMGPWRRSFVDCMVYENVSAGLLLLHVYILMFFYWAKRGEVECQVKIPR